MKKCALCQTKEANKTNTHYLTDAIIRSALNRDGVNKRGYGDYYDFTGYFIEHKLQSGASTHLEETLGRPLTEEEKKTIKNNVPFSVNHIFCEECEDKFNTIETTFASPKNSLLSLFREPKQELSNSFTVSQKQSKAFRYFFMLQIYRTAVCVPTLKISDELKEKLRLIVNSKNPQDSPDLQSLRLSITYMETLKTHIELLGEESNHTLNPVGGYSNKSVIFMNDFVIQFYENEIEFDELFGINDKNNFEKFINYNESEFVVRVLKDSKRQQIVEKIEKQLNLEKNDGWKELFILFFQKIKSGILSEDIAKQLAEEHVEQFISEFNNDKQPLEYKESQKHFFNFAYEFINKIILK